MINPCLDSYSEEWVDEINPYHDIASIGTFELAFANYVHCLIALERSPSRIK